MKARDIIGRTIVRATQQPPAITNTGERAAQLVCLELDNGAMLFFDIHHTEDLPFVGGRLVRTRAPARDSKPA